MDDEDTIIEGLSNYINWENLGFQLVGTANTIAQAITLIQENSVDVVLSDIHLEDESGLDLVGSLQKSHPHIKCLLLSGYGEFQYAQQALRFGVFDFLTKPVEFDLLHETFQRLFATLEEQSAQMLGDSDPLPGESPPLSLEEELPVFCLPDHNSTDVIETIKEYIGEHYGENITLQTLADQFFLHPIYLSKLFKSKTGQNFIDYLTFVRFSAAKFLLEDSNLKIYEISELCGYKSSKYFSKIFKSMSGFTPKEYRNSLGISVE